MREPGRMEARKDHLPPDSECDSTIEERLEGGDGRDGGLLTHFTWAAGEPEAYAECTMRE